MKDKTTAGILALLLGGLGIHKFYLGKGLQGLLYLIFCWTFIPAIVALIEGIMYLTMSQAEFDRKYNFGMVAAAAQPQNIVVNVANTASTGAVDITERLRSLLDLKSAGALTEDEFQAQKTKLLAAG
jgi:TM2 domain-containing membrane protein YozV